MRELGEGKDEDQIERLTLPTLPVVKTTSLNSFTIWPGPNSPREPPDLPEGQVLLNTKRSDESSMI